LILARTMGYPLPIVNHAGYFRGPSRNKPGQISDTFHARHVMGLHPRPGGKYISGSESYELSGPTMGLLPAGERDGNGLIGMQEFFFCDFDWEGLRATEGGLRVRLDLGAPLERSHLRRLSATEMRRGIGLFRELLTLVKQPGVAATLSASSKFLELLALWASPPQGAEGATGEVALYRELIEQYATDSSVSLSTLAERVGVNADYLGLRFRRELGLTPVEFRTRLRLERARELLATGPRRVAEVARASGFDDPKYFARLFQRAHGAAPRAYARRYGR